MAESPEKTGQNPASAEKLLEQEESVWGAEWEEAFKSEKDSDSFDTLEEDSLFFDSPGGEIKADESVQEISPAADAPHAANSSPGQLSIGGSATLLFQAILAAFGDLFLRIRSLPSSRLIFAGIATFALIVISAVFFITQSEVPPPLPQAAVPEALQQALTPVGPAVTEIIAPPPQKVRHKWPFSPFFIPAANTATGQTVYLDLRITLSVVMDKDTPLPEEKKTAVRDMIYRFFRNQPLDELQRYSLARGEMQRKLKDWILNEWPDAPVEAIIFDRYLLT